MSLVNAPVLGINLKQNTNSTSTAFGKYFPEVDRQPTLNTRGFAEHMIAHGSKYGLEDIQAILRMFATCLPELLAMGIGVKLDGLGVFLPYAESKKGITKAQMAGITPQEIVKAIHIRFQPDSTKLDNLAGPAFADRCSMEMRNVIIVDRLKDPTTGKVTEVLRTEVPINTFLSENYNGGTSNTNANQNAGGGSNQGGGTNTGGNSGGDNTGGDNTGGDNTGGDNNGGGGNPGGGMDQN